MKLISLNIEYDKHLEKILPFLKVENADIICLQEVLKDTIPLLQKELHMSAVHSPVFPVPPPHRPQCVVLLTKTKPLHVETNTFINLNTESKKFTASDENADNKGFIIAEIPKDDAVFKIITTHFTWTPEGEATPLQLAHFDTLMGILENQGEFVLCGDFNMPRGREMWEKLAEKYTDNIPREIKTTLDRNLHEKKNLQLVVDGVFSTKGCEVSNVRVVDGVSDHMAVVGEVKTKKLSSF